MPDPLPPDANFSSDSLPPRPPTPKYWLYALVLIFIVVCGALVALLNFYNAQLALERDKLDAARLRWRDAGVADYNLDVVVRGSAPGDYHIQVRGGKPTEASTMNGKPFENPGQARFWTVESLLEDVLAKELENNKKDPSCHSQVEFDPKLGFPKHYLKVAGTQQQTVFYIRLQTTDLDKKLPPMNVGGMPGARSQNVPAGSRPGASRSASQPAGSPPARPGTPSASRPKAAPTASTPTPTAPK